MTLPSRREIEEKIEDLEEGGELPPIPELLMHSLKYYHECVDEPIPEGNEQYEEFAELWAEALEEHCETADWDFSEVRNHA